jgi:hypothetical protein
MCRNATPPSAANASAWPCMNASCDWEASTRCTALPEYDSRSVNRWHLRGSPSSRTHTSAKSTSAFAAGSWTWGTVPSGCLRPSRASAAISGRRWFT